MSPSDPLHAAQAALARGRHLDVVRLVQPHFGAASPSVRGRAMVLGATSLAALGDRPTALKLAHLAVQLLPSEGAAWQLLGALFLQGGDASAAEQAWASGLQHAPGHVDCWLALADLSEQQGDRRKAAELLRQASLRHGHRVDLVHRYWAALTHLGAGRALLEAAPTTLARFPRHPGLRLLAARARYLDGDIDGAMADLEEVLAVDPRSVEARAWRAQYRLRARDLSGALADAEAVLAGQPNEPNARLVRARVALTEGRPTDALADLDTILATPDRLAEDTRGEALVRRGHAREALDDLEGALADFVSGQSWLARSPLARAAEPDRYNAMVDDKARALAPGAAVPVHAASWPTVVPASWPLAAAPPVFVFGFPRSGTTLVENILGAHPKLVATDERNILDAALRHHARGLNHKPLTQLTDADCITLRSHYARRALQFAPDGRRVVDKVPLNLVHTAFVRRVFPDAPILVVLRDARDCVWSSFVQAFSPNSAMVQTATVEGTAQLYVRTMEVWRRARDLPGLRATEVHYEDLVADIAAGARLLVTAAGEAWDDRVLEYRTTQRTVRTPSTHAIARPATTSRIGRWQRYPTAMAPVLPLLEASPFPPREQNA